MAKRKSAKLPPIHENKRDAHGRVCVASGSTETLALTRFYEDSLSAHEVNCCCDCGLEHLIVYTVFPCGREWQLTVRTYRLPKRT